MQILNTIFLGLLIFAKIAIAAEDASIPVSGPAGVRGKVVHYIFSDQRNGGALRVSEGVRSACGELGWKLEVFDGQGDNKMISKLIQNSQAAKADGIIVGGFNASSFKNELLNAKKHNIHIVGWHAAEKPGASDVLFNNITTDPQGVARLAAGVVKKFGPKKCGVIILTDSKFQIALTKSDHMKSEIENHKDCHLLEVVDIPISEASVKAPRFVEDYHRRYGSKWTHTLAINDVYFDHMNYALKSVKRRDIINISAGDGSSVAIGRIRSGQSQQVAAVAEPLFIQGWQVVDELNRSFSNVGPSDYMTKPIVLTHDFLANKKESEIDNINSVRAAYLRIWKAK